MSTIYRVKLSFWATPTAIEAECEDEAREIALRLYPTCDCCDAKTKVEYVNA